MKKIPQHPTESNNPVQLHIDPTPLTQSEKNKLQQLEAVTEKNIRGFYETGMALLQIRDLRLYREGYKSFDEYCHERWGMSRQRAYQSIDYAGVTKNLSTAVDKDHLPPEWATRPLTKYLPERQKEIWVRAVEISDGDGTVTSKHVRQAILEIDPPDPDGATPGIRKFQGVSMLERQARRIWDGFNHDERVRFINWIRDWEREYKIEPSYLIVVDRKGKSPLQRSRERSRAKGYIT